MCDEGKIKKILIPDGIDKLHGAYWILVILNLLGLTNFVYQLNYKWNIDCR